MASLLPTDPNLRTAIAISLGAIPGALCRYYLTMLLAHWFGEGFPLGTFVINITGAFLMGFIFTLALERSLIAPELRTFLAVGFLGSYTTFSTYALDTLIMIKTKPLFITLFYWLGSSILGAIAVTLGSLLGRQWPE
ncbi:MAG: fluoride efflux transporter CrcB [Microcystaceae cyanobacterium]